MEKYVNKQRGESNDKWMVRKGWKILVKSNKYFMIKGESVNQHATV